MSAIDFNLFSTECGLLALAIACLFVDLFAKHSEQRIQTILRIATTGLVVLLINLFVQHDVFGTLVHGTFVQDGLAHFFKVLFIISGIFVLQMSKDYFSQMKNERAEFVLLILFALIGMCLLVSANNFILFFVALETMTLALYINTAYLRDQSISIEAGVKFLILGAVSTALMVYGLSFIFGLTGSTAYTGIQKALFEMGTIPPAFIFGVMLVLAGLGFKIAIFPFHFWVPDVYQGAPTPITAFLAMGSKAAAIGALIRLLMTVFHHTLELPSMVILLAILSGLTILIGNFGALAQTNIKRLLAYSSIGHAGYLAMGLAAFQASGKEGVLYYLLAYVFSTAAAFLVVVIVSNHVKSDEITDYAGLSEKSPLLAAGMLIALFSLAGMPPLAGFFGKFYVLSAAVRAGLGWLALLGLINVVLSLYYYLRVVKVMYLDTAESAWTISLSKLQKTIQYVAIAGIVIMGVAPGPFVAWIQSVYLNFLQF